MARPSAAHDPPPPYPGPSSAFVLPLYETAAALDCWDDSYCLPPYQARTGQRFHPYNRILPVHRGYIPRQEKSFEEFYRSLQQSVNCRTGASTAVVEAPTALPAQAAANNPVAAPPRGVVGPGPRPMGQGPVRDPEERLRRLL